MAGLGAIGRALRVFSFYGFGVPIIWIGRGIFRLFLLPAYRGYTQIKQRIKNNPHLAGLRSLEHFFQRYALYAILVILGLAVAGNNIFARTIRPDEVGQGAVWTTLTQAENSDIIVETGLSAPIAKAAAPAVGGLPPAEKTLVAEAGAAVDQDTGQLSETASTVGGVQAPTGENQGIQEYTVQGGDTISSIAADFNVSSQTVLWANGLGETDYIKPGQVLKIPPVSGLLYTVKAGDTIASIVKKYGGTEQDILDANSLPLAEALQVGQNIIIPGGQPPAPVQTYTVPTPRNLLERVFVRQAPPSAPAGGGGRFLWPTPGRRINQYFRGRWHTGLDIDGDYSSPIYAAAAGRITFAAYDRSGYGLHIVIDNGSGYSTLYAHASKVFVQIGQQVSRGQTIAMVGSTGRSTGTHLHFEVRIGGTPVNPLAYF